MSGSGKHCVHVLYDGYSRPAATGTQANCSCTLITGCQNIIVDTMTTWDGQKLLSALNKHNLTPDDIQWVVCTHGHSDHVGCNYLFHNARHVVGFCYSHKDSYFDHDFSSGTELVIEEGVKIVPTPGHTLQDVTVIVDSADKGVVAITGDLFEREEDIEDASIWKAAGCDSEELQEKNRKMILEIADWIVPGHGPMFKVVK